MQSAITCNVPMGIYEPTERVLKLRERAMKAIDTHAMWYQRSRTNADDRYGWDDRQLLNFYKAWLKHADAPTTLLRRTLAEADMIALLIFDESTQSMNIISLNRDTMTDVQVLGIGGKKAGTVHAQLALAHAYGSGLRDSSENLRDTVSMLMYNAQIDYYVTINMEAINLLNDAGGGVTVNVTDDFSAIDPSIPMGQVTLKGQQATNFLRSRYGVGDQMNLTRMQRHQEYIRGFLTALQTKYEAEPSFVLRAFEQINPYMVTNCTTSSISGLLDRYGDFELGEMLTLKGENNAQNEYMEYHLDMDALDELILKYLYSPKK